MQLRWSPRASSDFEAIFEFIAAENESAAVRQARLILQASRQIESFPQCGRKAKGRNSRELPVAGTPYILFYTVHEQDLNLISIKHGAMR